ncbi:MAG: glycosyltransferase [Lachnospiraceae bacterium]|nr:glycosyltransferase [Lachnospiraceae bacterium]
MAALILSVITVCRNAKTPLEATMENILSQDFAGFEYLVIDGASDDGTPEFLEKCGRKFNEKEIPFRFVSEPDRGIYDAMNKGTRLAAGEWLLFLNAGDLLSSAHILSMLFPVEADVQILYGDTICVYQGRRGLYPALPLDRLKEEMAFCHQSAFIKRELLLETPYDISYRICADHHFFLRMYLDGKVFAYHPEPIAIYEISGYSDEHPLRSHREQRRMQRELGVFHLSPARILRECTFYLKLGIKKIFGQRLIDRVRKSRLHA